MSRQEDKPVDYEQRAFVNLAAAAFLLFYALIFGWTVMAVHDWMQMERCISSGRRDCADVPQPPRGVLILPQRGPGAP